MPTEHILSLLIAEREKLNRAIEALQGPVKRRGRPPKNETQGGWVSSGRPVKKRGWSAARKKTQAAKMKAYWAKRRKNAGK